MCRVSKGTQIQHVDIQNQGRSETQLQTASVPKTAKALGFTRSLVDSACRDFHFSIPFQGFGCIRSTQPIRLWGYHFF